MTTQVSTFTSLIGGSLWFCSRLVPLLMAATYPLTAGAVDQTNPQASPSVFRNVDDSEAAGTAAPFPYEEGFPSIDQSEVAGVAPELQPSPDQ